MTTPDIRLEDAVRAIAPDGSTVHLLAAIGEGGAAVFELGPGAVARPVRHPRVQEIWYVLAGRGRIWRQAATGEGRITELVTGVSLAITRGTAFQFRCDGDEPLRVLGFTAPPWAGDADAEHLDRGEWRPTL